MSGCTAWILIADEFGIARGARRVARTKIGMDIALEEECEATGDTTKKAADIEDAIDAVTQSDHLEADDKKVWIQGLRDGSVTAEQAFQCLEAYENIA